MLQSSPIREHSNLFLLKITAPDMVLVANITTVAIDGCFINLIYYCNH